MAQLFLEIIDQENEVITHITPQIELCKQILVKKEEFELYCVFTFLDTLQKGYLTYQDIKLFIQRNTQSISAYINLGYWKSRGNINYSMFSSMILPKRSKMLKFDVIKRNPSLILPIEKISESIVTDLLKLFEKESELEDTLNEIRKEIKSLSIIPFKLFEMIDCENIHFINPMNLTEFFKSVGENILKSGAQRIIEKYDIDGDGKLSYMEFLNIIIPFEDDNECNKEFNNHKFLQRKNSLKVEESKFYETPCHIDDASYGQVTTTATALVGSLEQVIGNADKLNDPKVSSFSIDEDGINDKPKENHINKNIELKKLNLLKKSDFSLPGLFKFFNADIKKGITLKNMSDTFESMKFKVKNLPLLFKKYAVANGKTLLPKEIEDMFLPTQTKFASSKQFSKDTEEALKNLFTSLTNFELEQERSKQKNTKKESLPLNEV